MASEWNDFDFVVQMPHMAPGEKLSEVELLKILAAYQWESISRALGRRPPAIVNAAHERLYGSVIDVELHLGPRHSMEILGEDARVHVRNRVRFYAKKFAEGIFLIDDREIPDTELDGLHGRSELRRRGSSWACMTNAFIARSGGNVRLKVFKPVGADDPDVPQTSETPLGIVEQGRVQASGEIDPLDESTEGGFALRDRSGRPIRYHIVPESDLNGAGLVYFARYEAMMNYGERLFLGERLEWPISTELISCLSTEHRRAYFFANASPSDAVDVRISATLLPAGQLAPPPVSVPYRVAAKIAFRIDLHRSSDNVLMASSLVRKSLNVPGSSKAVLNEVERLLRRLR